MVIELCAPKSSGEERWDNFVQHSPTARHYHLSPWRRVIEGAYGHSSFYLHACEDGETTGILPLILIRSPLFGRSLVSLPFLDEGGICSKDAPTTIALWHEAVRLFRHHNADWLDLRHRHPNTLELTTHGAKVTFILGLEDGPERMWRRLDPKLRNQIRKSLRSGLTASWAGREALAEFYDVFATNMRDLGSPVHSRGFFARILDEFPTSARLILVRNGALTIGAGLCLLFKDTVLLPWASSNRKYFSLCPNNLLYWEAIRWGSENGYRSFDFGRSSPGTGTYRFKKQWGALEQPLHWQCLGRKSAHTPLVDARDSAGRWAAYLWKRVPLAITKHLGPVLRRQMSN